jgi:hypothetical protein
MPTWTARTEGGMKLGSYRSKLRMFKEMKWRFAGSKFWAVTETGPAYLYEVRLDGSYHVRTHVPGQETAEVLPWSTG